MVKKIMTIVTVLGLILCSLPVGAAALEPTIAFDTIQSTGIVDQADLSAFTVSVTGGENAITSVTLRIDGSVVGTDSSAPYTFNVSLNELGSHKAEAIVKDAADLYYRQSAWFNLAAYSHETPVGTDFEGFSSHPENGLYGPVTTYASEDGIYTPVQRNAEDATAGTCLQIDAHDGKNFELYMQKSLSDSNMDKLVYQTVDFKFSDTSSSSYISAQDRSGNNSTFFRVYADGTITVNNVSVGTLANPTGTWHTISFLANQKLGVEDLRVDGDLIASNVSPYTNGVAAGAAGLMRLWFKASNGTDIMIDNYFTNTVIESVYATGGAAAYGQKSFSFTTSRALGDTAVAANFSLESELGAAEIDSVTLGENNLVTITTKEDLEPANSYVLKIKSGTPLADNTTVTTNTRYAFSTTARETDWLTGDICPIEEGYIFSGTVANASGETLRAVCAVFDSSGTFLNCKIVPVAVDGTFLIQRSAGHNMQIKGFVVDENWNPISDKFYTATIE